MGYGVNVLPSHNAHTHTQTKMLGWNEIEFAGQVNTKSTDIPTKIRMPN